MKLGSGMILSCVVAALGASAPPAQEPEPASSEPVAAGAYPEALGPPPADLAGVQLGESRASIDARFHLRGLVPFLDDGGERYVIEPAVRASRTVREDLEARGVGRLEFRLRKGRVDWVRAEMTGRTTEMFDEAAAVLFRRYGVPSEEVGRGPMQVGRAHGVRLYYWIRLWTWNWDGVRLVVQGDHYGDDKYKEQALRHSYIYTLEQLGSIKGSVPAGSR